ncbi:hypothetical protein ACH5RR_007117 [Cinchona calisaya]|uniref:Uncharacterized protein n=1 Tax=Cinchona calisaya TaxID=153742 RepID=A0ABD3AQX1_9GENT
MAAIMEKADENVLPSVHKEVSETFSTRPSDLGYLTFIQNFVQGLASPMAGVLTISYDRPMVLAVGTLCLPHHLRENKTLEIVFPKECRKLVKYAAQLANTICYAVRHLPLPKDVHTYDKILKERKEHLFGALLWKNTMHYDCKMLKAKGKDLLTSCPYDWIEQDERKSMCDWFEDPKFKVSMNIA